MISSSGCGGARPISVSYTHLGKLLRNELIPPEEETEDKPRRNLAELLGLNRKGADDHVGTDL